jgi:drug/metabolite transporter (DMT)-like permease
VLASLLALLASVVWGTSDFMAGLESRRMTSWGVILVAMPVAAAGALVSAAVLSPAAPAATMLLIVAAGGACSAVSGIAYFKAVTFTKMSVMSPILAGAAVLPVLWGLVRGEQPHPLQIVGIVATVTGIVVISRPGPTAPDDKLPITAWGVFLAVVASVSAGLMLITLDYGADTDPYWAVAGMRVSAAIWTVLWIAAARPALHLRRRSLPILVVIGLMIPLANTLFAAATSMAELSVVAVLGWLSPAVTILCARLILHERLRPVQWLAAGAVLLGVVCLALG